MRFVLKYIVWKLVWWSTKKLNMELLYDSALLLLGAHFKEMNSIKSLYTNNQSSTIHTAQWQKQSKCPSVGEWLNKIRSTHTVEYSVQFSSVAQLCPTLCDPKNRSTPGLPVHHQLPEFTQTHVHRVSDAIQPSHPVLSPSPSAPNPSQHQSLFQWVNSSHEVAKVLSYKKEWRTDACYMMDESWKFYTEWKKQIPKATYVLYHSICMTCPNQENPQGKKGD